MRFCSEGERKKQERRDGKGGGLITIGAPQSAFTRTAQHTYSAALVAREWPTARHPCGGASQDGATATCSGAWPQPHVTEGRKPRPTATHTIHTHHTHTHAHPPTKPLGRRGPLQTAAPRLQLVLVVTSAGGSVTPRPFHQVLRPWRQ